MPRADFKFAPETIPPPKQTRSNANGSAAEPPAGTSERTRAAANCLMLDCAAISLDPAAPARLGDASEYSPAKLADLIESIRASKQHQPALVREDPIRAGMFLLVAGRRRYHACLTLGVPLLCYVAELSDTEAHQAGCHENLKRKGFSALDFALLCAEVRRLYEWPGSAGTRKVAGYLGVSPASVTQHEKYLRRPDAMSEADFDKIQGGLRAYSYGSIAGISPQAALSLLCDVEPSRAGEVLDVARELRELEEPEAAMASPQDIPAFGPGESQDEPEEGTPDSSALQDSQNSPSASNARKRGRGRPLGSRNKPTQAATPAEPPPKHPENVAAPATPQRGKGVSQAHIARAAKALDASKPAAASKAWRLADVREFFEPLSGPGYPIPLRMFAKLLSARLDGGTTDETLYKAWDALAKAIAGRS